MLPVNDRTTGPLEMTGGETLIPFDFKVLAAADLAVWRSRGGAVERLALTADYTVTGIGQASGGDVVLTTAALAGDVLVVEGLRPAARTADLVYDRAMPPAALNGEYDSLQVQIAELRRDVDRSLKVSRFEEGALATELPPVEAGMAIGFDDDGHLDFVSGGGAGGSIPDPLPIDDGGTGATDAAGARSNLGFGALATLSSVGAAQIGSAAVTTDKIAAGAVTAGKLSDGVVWWTVESATVAVPPASPADGQAWLVPAGASGAWASQVGRIAVRVAAAWSYKVPAKGWLALALDDRRGRHYSGTAWHLLTVETLSGRIATAIPANRFGGGRTRTAIVNGSHVIVWGDGAGGKNGLLGGRDALLPEMLPFESPPVTPLKRLVSGDGIHFVIDGADDVWSAGDGASGCLGHGNTTDLTQFRRIDALYSAGVKVREVIVGRPGSSDVPVVFFITTTDTAWACGRGDSGERGDGTTTTTTSTPSAVLLDGGTTPLGNIDTISVGSYPHTVAARRKDGTFCRWGYNSHGQLGTGDTVIRSKAVPHATLTGIAEVLAVSDTDSGNILVRTTAGHVHGAGRNSEGQLAQGADLAAKSSFVAISYGETFKRIFCGPGRFAHFGGITASDRWVTWGYNGQGQLGDGTTTQRATIVEPAGSWQGEVTDAVLAGDNIYVATYVMAGGVLYASGYNGDSNCCNGVGTANLTTFSRLVGLEPGATIAAWGVYGNVASYGPMLLTADGRLVTGGAGGQGELGWMPSSPVSSTVMQEVLIRGLRGQGGDAGTPGATGAGYGGTSTTSVAIGTGSKSLTTQALLAYQVGALVRVASTASGEQSTHWMYGDVTAYDPATGAMTVNVVDQRGSGATRAAWSVNIAGQSGDVTPEATALATAAAASASAASTSATAAATSATAAAASATAASTSATNASGSATTASTAATNAGTLATSAASSASAASTSATNASTSATAAATSATNAGNSATAAATSATNAASSETAAAVSATAAANAAAALTATSTTSLAIGSGSKVFTTQSGKQFTAGQMLIAASAANVANYMVVQVDSYSVTTLTTTVQANGTGGSGTYADWIIAPTGKIGIQGPAGSLDVGALSSVAPATDDKLVLGDTSNSDATAYTTPAALPISTATQSALDGKVGAAAAFSNDNRLLRSDGTGRDAQASGISVDDSNNVSGVGNLSLSGTVNGRDVAADGEKLDYITVTQAIDLDAIETRVNGLDAAVVLKGTWDASGGSFPGSGSAQAGWSYIVSTGGTVDSTVFAAGDRIIAIVDNASTSTYASNWFKADYTDQVSSVAGRTGAVTLAQADVSGLTTSDSPQLAGVNVGHATDTTITRGAAGEIEVKGSRVWQQGNVGARINALTTDSAPAGDDFVPTYDTSAAGAKKVAMSDLRSEVIVIPVSDEATAITTGTAKVTFRMPFAMTLTAARASLSTASSSGTPTIDVNEGGTSILSTKLTIDANEKTSTTAATAAVLSDTSLADDAEITIDIDTAGTGAKGLKVSLIGYRT